MMDRGECQLCLKHSSKPYEKLNTEIEIPPLSIPTLTYSVFREFLRSGLPHCCTITIKVPRYQSPHLKMRVPFFFSFPYYRGGGN